VTTTSSNNGSLSFTGGPAGQLALFGLLLVAGGLSLVAKRRLTL
jgi:hypothetical protein